MSCFYIFGLSFLFIIPHPLMLTRSFAHPLYLSMKYKIKNLSFYSTREHTRRCLDNLIYNLERNDVFYNDFIKYFILHVILFNSLENK